MISPLKEAHVSIVGEGREDGIRVVLNNVEVETTRWPDFRYSCLVLIYVQPKDKHIDLTDSAVSPNMQLDNRRAQWMSSVRKLVTALDTVEEENLFVSSVDYIDSIKTLPSEILLPYTADIAASNAIMGFTITAVKDPQQSESG